METFAFKGLENAYLNSLTNILDFLPKKENYAEKTDEELLEILKKSPDFDKMVFPNHWYSKFNLPEKSCRDMKQFIQESPWLKTSHNYYVGKVELPPKPGGLRPILPAPEVPTITMIQNSFSDNPKLQLTDQIVGEHLQDSHVSFSDSRESNETKTQQ